MKKRKIPNVPPSERSKMSEEIDTDDSNSQYYGFIVGIVCGIILYNLIINIL